MLSVLSYRKKIGGSNFLFYLYLQTPVYSPKYVVRVQLFTHESSLHLQCFMKVPHTLDLNVIRVILDCVFQSLQTNT